MATGAVALVVAAAVAVYAVEGGEGAVATTCYLGVLVGASVGAWIGAERAPRKRRLVPRLIAAGVSLTAIGDVLWNILDSMGVGTDVSIADPPWFASYIVLCAALWVVIGQSRRRSPGRGGSRVDVDFVIDAGTIVVVSVLIFWSISVDAILADHSVAPLVRTVWAAYPIADAVLLALVVHVLMSRNARTAIDASFAVGVCLWLAADVAYLQALEGVAAKVMMDAAWMVAPVLLARAAWRVREIQTDAPGSSALGGWVAQLMVAIGPLFVPTALELTGHLRGEESAHPLQLFIGTAALIALAFARTARLIRSEERTRRELEEARDAALEASRAKSMFLANMSHEIRTPLTTVLATAEILEDTHLDDVQLMLMGKMHRSGELLKTLVEGILDFSRIEAGQLKLTSTPFDLRAMVADAADVYAPRALRAAIRFEWHLDPCVPRMVVGDPGRLFQVLTNVLDNALKFTHQGTVSLTVLPDKTDDKGDRADEVVEFLVIDTGIGIRAEDQESVFESFSQVDGTTTRRYGGNGLGLAICKELTQLMGGSITVQSQFGAGSTFVIRIPLPSAVQDHIAPRHASSLSPLLSRSRHEGLTVGALPAPRGRL
jgi:signal transduction histidine kinase